MRAILAFRLPQEQEEFDNAVHGSDWRYAMQELDEYLRHDVKHGTRLETSEEIRQVLHRILRERGLALFD